MIKLFVFLWFWASASLLLGQDYFVMQVSGTILNLSTQKDLQKGMTISSKDKLRFGSAEAYAVVIDKHAGRKMLDGHAAKKDGSKNEFIAFVTDVLLPTTANRQLSTRASADHEIADLQAYFGKEKFLFIGDTFTLPVSKAKYILDTNNIMALRYYYDDKSAYKRVSSNTDNLLVFDKKQILTNDTIMVNPHHIKKCDLIYFNKLTKVKTEVATFLPLFASEDNLLAELEKMKSFLELSELTEEKLKAEVFDYVKQNYGKTDELTLEKWLKSKKYFKNSVTVKTN